MSPTSRNTTAQNSTDEEAGNTSSNSTSFPATTLTTLILCPPTSLPSTPKLSGSLSTPATAVPFVLLCPRLNQSQEMPKDIALGLAGFDQIGVTPFYSLPVSTKKVKVPVKTSSKRTCNSSNKEEVKVLSDNKILSTSSNQEDVQQAPAIHANEIKLEPGASAPKATPAKSAATQLCPLPPVDYQKGNEPMDDDDEDDNTSDSQTISGSHRCGRSPIPDISKKDKQEGMRMANGALWSTPTDILDVYAHLLPVEYLVDKVRAGAALRLATHPATNPLHAAVHEKGAHTSRTHPTPLYNLLHNFGLESTKMETIRTVCTPATWTSTMKVEIPVSKDA
ncbi:hypothetical protein B0H14DRAFT_3495314 [Mycena olivaceomarginata]|nr:hypothetical protein B0H14DRAFT_3495314 [Mycena olivaceomarginata]